MKEVNLQTINKGSVVQLFDREFSRVLENIADDNTDSKVTRSVTIKVTIKPDAERTTAETKVSVSCKLAPLKNNDNVICISSDGSAVHAFQRPDERQIEFTDFDEIGVEVEI